MNRIRLNLSLLRRFHDPVVRRSVAEFDGLTDNGIGRQISRREWLGAAGSTAILATPVVRSVSSLSFGRADVKQGKGWVAFLVRGEERWRIDISKFSGTPRLFVERKEKELRLRLSGARYPGTDLPADFDCTIRPKVFSSSMTIKFALGELEGECDFERWLLGLCSLALSGKGGQAEVDLALEVRLKLEESYVGSFEPDWSLTLSAEGCVLLEGLEEPLRGDSLRIHVPGEAEPSLLLNVPSRRTLLVLERFGGTWDLIPALDGLTFKLIPGGGGFDTVRVETAESVGGVRRSGLVLEAEHGGPALAARFPGSLRDLSGREFDLPLIGSRYALAFGGRSVDRALFARYSDTPSWFSAEGASFSVGNGPAALPFEVVAPGGVVSSVRCEPELLVSLLPLQGALVEPHSHSGPARGAARGTARLSLSTEGPQIQVQKKPAPAVLPGGVATPQTPAVQQVKPSQEMAAIRFTDPKVSAIRREDLLKIDFEFEGFMLAAEGGAWSLKRKGGGGAAYIIANFPPQNIGEQAFYEATTAAGSEAPTEPPVKSRLSGPSRLVFRIPATVTAIPFTLEDVLQACMDADLNVSAAAARLTSRQAAFLNSLKAVAPAAKSSLGSLKAAAQSVKSAAPSGAVISKGGRDTLVNTARTMRLSQLTVRDNLAGLEVPRVLQKRVELMQNLVARDAAAGNKGLAASSDTLTKTLEGMETMGYVATTGGILAPAVVSLIAKPANPGPLETAIECPFRLIVSPNAHAAWVHALKPVTIDGRTELWHTRLAARSWGKKANEDLAILRTLRAVWSPDYRDALPGPGDPPGTYGTDDNPFRMSLNRQDRHEIVHLTSDPAISNYIPLPVDVDRLMLSSLGAWMNVYGYWGDIPPMPLSVQSWRHRATMGRDSYVRVVYAGFLFPFGHRAALIKITERKFQRSPSGKIVAYLRQRLYIVIRQLVRTFPASGQLNDARGNPFRSVRVTTLITPNLDNPGSGVRNKGESAFWPMVDTQSFQFHMIGEDWEGRQVDFTTPAIFMKQGIAADPVLDDIGSDYGKVTDARRLRPMAGQKIAFADSTVPGDTTYEADSVAWGVDLYSGDRTALVNGGGAPFYPTFDQATVNLKSVGHLTGADAKRKIEFHDDYLTGGFGGGNKGEVFARLTDVLQSDFSKDASKSGGLIAPNVAISGLSRTIGAVGGKLDEMKDGTFDPVSFFEGALSLAKLFGCIPLTAILQKVMDFKGMLDRIPVLITEESPDVYLTKYEWRPKVAQSLGALTDGTVLDGISFPTIPRTERWSP